jgi:hypothetical protein
MTSVAMTSEPQPTEPSECEACKDLRAALRLCLGALAKYYGEELDRNDWRELSVSELVQGGVVLRAERALRAPCRCGRSCA